MPVKVPDNLPAVKALATEGVVLIEESRAFRQDIRPLKIAILNLMPNKQATESQLLRLLSASPLQVAVTLLHTNSYKSKHTHPGYFEAFYRTFADIQGERFDGLIITGAPVETMEFRKVAYWEELSEIMDWSRRNVYSSLHICWGAQAGMFYHYGIPKHTLHEKLYGVFLHIRNNYRDPLLHGIDDVFLAPHSRYTATQRDEILRSGKLRILAESEEAGPYLISGHGHRQIFITGHPEYDRLTLQTEWQRNTGSGLPANYFPNSDCFQAPVIRWRGHAMLLFSNWLNFVYQRTCFNLENLEPIRG